MSAMTDELKIDRLPAFQKRHFVPDKANLTDKNEVTALYAKLLERPISSSGELEQWLTDRSELEACLDQAGTVLYIRMTCQTDDPLKAKAYQNFIETVVPAVKPLDDGLNKKYLEARKKFPLDEAYAIYDRTIQSDIDFFRQENVPLQTKVALLSQEYQTICGAMTVSFNGQEYTLPQMSKFLLEQDRLLRENAWRAVAERRLKDKQKLDHLFDEMLKLRHKIALNADCRDFCEYQFRAYHRFDYTQNDCHAYHAAIEKCVLPVLKKILSRRCERMRLSALRPWDTAVDPTGRPPLKPFSKIEELLEGTKTIFSRLDKELGTQFAQMINLGLLDLASRKGKAPGGYQSTLTEARKPFIFMNAVGVDDDVHTLLHEGGHAFHALASASQKLFSYRHAPMEFCEVASMGMELLGNEFLSAFYAHDDEERSRTEHLEDVVSTLVWVAVVDAFQEWIYAHPEQTPEERAKAWLATRKRFGSDLIDWSGLEKEQTYLWHRQLHIFEVPFYYIEYGIAQLGALQLWLSAKKDRSKALEQYRYALSLGRSRPLPELFAAAGLKFDFAESTVAPLMELISKELKLK